MIVCIEGGDAAGKHTLATALIEQLKARRDVSTFAFPAYHTEVGKTIRLLLTDEIDVPKPWKALVLQSMMTINRLEFLPMLHDYKLNRNKLLILDRYWLSALVYGSAAGLPAEWIETIHQGLPTADLTMLIDVSVEESFRRRPERRDRHERDAPFLEKVRENYLTYFRTMGESDKRLVMLDGHKEPEFVLADALHAMAKFAVV